MNVIIAKIVFTFLTNFLQEFDLKSNFWSNLTNHTFFAKRNVVAKPFPYAFRKWKIFTLGEKFEVSIVGLLKHAGQTKGQPKIMNSVSQNPRLFSSYKSDRDKEVTDRM